MKAANGLKLAHSVADGETNPENSTVFIYPLDSLGAGARTGKVARLTHSCQK